RQAAALFQDVVEARPMHGEQQCVGVLRCFCRSACTCAAARVARQSLELLLAPRVAEDHLMTGASPNCPELPTHQTRTQNANSHLPSPCLLLFPHPLPSSLFPLPSSPGHQLSEIATAYLLVTRLHADKDCLPVADEPRHS